MTKLETPAAVASTQPSANVLAVGFPIQIPLLSRGTADRSEDLREPSRYESAWPDALMLVVDPVHGADVDQTESGPVLRLRPARNFGGRPPANAVLLGRVAADDPPNADGHPDADRHLDVWAVPGDVADGGGLRELAALLPDRDAGLLTAAVAILGWHRSDPFCPQCGQPNTSRHGGWSRHCPNGHEEFPRSDPAVIMLVHDGGDRIVLARQPVWPTGRVSVLAGFVEAGESLEATVAREIQEEIGVRVRDISYLGSQPWPFPRSLMVGFAARAESGAVLRPRAGEIEEANWIDRATVRRILSAGGDAEGIALPGEVSIARRMIEGWAALD